MLLSTHCADKKNCICLRKVWRYIMGSEKPYWRIGSSMTERKKTNNDPEKNHIAPKDWATQYNPRLTGMPWKGKHPQLH